MRSLDPLGNLPHGVRWETSGLKQAHRRVGVCKVSRSSLAPAANISSKALTAELLENVHVWQYRG